MTNYFNLQREFNQAVKLLNKLNRASRNPIFSEDHVKEIVQAIDVLESEVVLLETELNKYLTVA